MTYAKLSLVFKTNLLKNDAKNSEMSFEWDNLKFKDKVMVLYYM